jgi:hypothetical protein
MSQDFEKADQAVLRAAKAIESAIESAVTELLAATLPLERVAADYVIEGLVAALMERNPQALEYLNKQPGEATMALANALMDWRDDWAGR